MMPNGWKMKTVTEAGIVVTDGDRGKEYPNSSEFLDDGYCLFLSAKNVTKKGFVFEDTQFISKEKHQLLRKGTVKRGDVVLTTRGTVGQTALYDNSVKYDVIRINSGMATLSCDGSELLSDFFYAYTNSSLFKRQIESLTFGSAQPQLTIKIIKSLKAPVPPLPEQQKIAKILTTWDKAINTTERLIENSKQQKKALMQQLLTGQKRLLDDSGQRFSGDWEEFKLGELFKERVETGFTDLPLLSITSSQGIISRDDVGRKDTSNADKSKYRRIMPGDIGYNTMRMWQGVSGLSNLEGIVSPAYTILTPTENVCAEYAAYLFKLPRLVHIFERNSQGLVSDTWNLKYSNFKKIKFPFPSKPEQKKIAAVLTTTDREIEVLEQQLTDLQQEKKALMQQLLTGKKRVKVD